MISVRISLVWLGLLLALDQGSKVWVRLRVPLHESAPLIPNLIDLTHVENAGVSFSFLAGLPSTVRVPLLLLVSCAAVVLLGGYWLRHRQQLNLWAQLAFVFILPGALGNLIDRALYGTVTDFLHFRFFSYSFFVNNVADILISAGVVSYVIGLLARPKAAAAER